MSVAIQNPKSKIKNHTSSASIATRAERYLVGGVNSPVRAFRRVGRDPLILIRSAGADVIDAKGRKLADFIMGWGALILGHNYPAVIRAIQRGVDRGVMMGLTHPDEIELARIISEAVRSVEQVRFTVSGTEACMTAVRLARAHTGRTKILTFEGCYHGHGESFMAARMAGLSGLATQETVQVPFNDVPACEAALQRYGDELACVIVEPVAANMGVIKPEPGYLERLRALTSQHAALLIFDEVVTGFRVAWGGAQELFGVTPDLTTFGKIIGGGLPIGAVGGPKRLMQRLAPEGDVFHGGTFAGHPLSMAAGIATLTALKRANPYARLERTGQRLGEALAETARAASIPVQINRVGSMLTLFFSETPVTNFTQAYASQQERFAQWANVLCDRGLLVPPSPFEALFLSTQHASGHRERFVEASRAAFRSMST